MDLLKMMNCIHRFYHDSVNNPGEVHTMRIPQCISVQKISSWYWSKPVIEKWKLCFLIACRSQRKIISTWLCIHSLEIGKSFLQMYQRQGQDSWMSRRAKFMRWKPMNIATCWHMMSIIWLTPKSISSVAGWPASKLAFPADCKSCQHQVLLWLMPSIVHYV